MKYNKHAVVINGVVPLREKNTDYSERVDELLLGMDVDILSYDNGWYFVKTFYDYEGYINEKDVLTMEEDKYKKWKNNAIFYAEQSTVDVLKEPKYNSPIIKTITMGALLCYFGETKDNWSKVILPDGESGWMKTDFIKRIEKRPLTDEKVIRENLVKTAKLYLKTQYRWGGKTHIGIDCSGLCFMAYLLNGFIIYRDAVLKRKYMKKIDIKEIKLGDLLFFPGHVAMYIGNDEYIHSNAKAHGVSINSLNANAYNYREDLVNSITDVGTIF